MLTRTLFAARSRFGRASRLNSGGVHPFAKLVAASCEPNATLAGGSSAAGGGGGPGSLDEAKAELVRAQAKAVLRRAEAEAAATRERATAEGSRATAEGSRASAEAAAVRDRASGEAAARQRQRLLFNCAFAGAFAGAAALAVDWVVHDSPAFIKWSMAAQLRACRLPAAADAALTPGELLPVPQVPFKLRFLPTMVLAPSGAGKSTLLAEVARETSTPADASCVPAPVVLVRVQQTPSVNPRSLQSPGVNTQENALAAACAQLDATAARIYTQIGYPARRSVLQRALDRGVTLTAGDATLHLHKAALTTSRLVDAFNTLFEVCAQLRRERVAAGMSPQDAAPVLLFDEVQDLIRDDRLARVGGIEIFNALAKLLVIHGVDDHAVRTAVTGSSALLSVYFERTVASGGRWRFYELPDPEPEVVARALRAHGYTAAEAEDMIALCGTRLRLLEEPLTCGADGVGARAFMDAARMTASAHLLDALRAPPDPADARALVAVLDAVAQYEAGQRKEPPVLGRAFTERHAEAASKVLYVRRDRSLTFQSRLHADAWSSKRASLIANAK